MNDLTINEIDAVSGGATRGMTTAVLITGIALVAYFSSSYSQPKCRLENVPHQKVIPIYDPVTGAHVSNRIIDYTLPEWVC